MSCSPELLNGDAPDSSSNLSTHTQDVTLQLLIWILDLPHNFMGLLMSNWDPRLLKDLSIRLHELSMELSQKQPESLTVFVPEIQFEPLQDLPVSSVISI